jgi:hypothetical protein
MQDVSARHALDFRTKTTIESANHRGQILNDFLSLRSVTYGILHVWIVPSSRQKRLSSDAALA